MSTDTDQLKTASLEELKAMEEADFQRLSHLLGRPVEPEEITGDLLLELSKKDPELYTHLGAVAGQMTIRIIRVRV